MNLSKKYALTNPLHPDIFRSLSKMETEIIKMCLSLYKAPPSGVGLFTGGGSESLGMAVLAARNRAFEKGIKWPEVIMCKTAHSGIDKACHYFRVKLIKTDYDYKTMTASISKIRSQINRLKIL